MFNTFCTAFPDSLPVIPSECCHFAHDLKPLQAHFRGADQASSASLLAPVSSRCTNGWRRTEGNLMSSCSFPLVWKNRGRGWRRAGEDNPREALSIL